MLYLDFETRCSLDLTEVGLYNYAMQAEIICTGAAWEDEPTRCYPGPPKLEDLYALQESDCPVVAHNAGFEKALLEAHGIDIPWERWIDTAAVAAAMSLPRKLEKLAEALKLTTGKDMAGAAIMKKLSRPKRGYGTHEFWSPEEKSEDFAKLYAYCKQDVEVMRECLRRMSPLPAREQALWALTGRMNDRGIPIDIASLAPAQAVLATQMAAGEAAFRRYSGGPGLRSYARAATALGMPNMTKPTVRRALRHPHIPHRVKAALELFLRLAKSSPAKLQAMVDRTSPDGRSRGMLVYAGAERTGRWSGAGVQPQNFPRGMGAKTDEAFVALQAGGLEMIYDHPVEAITDMLRGFFTGPLLVGDYSQIEARTLAWLAGQQDLLDVFAAKQDPYAFMASRLYGRPITKDSTDDSLPPGITPRFMGKQVVLGCGYGMGAEKFQTMLSDVYDVDIEAATAMKTINIYRRANQSIVKWWGKLEEAAQEALRKPGTVTTAGRVTMETATIGGFLYLLVHLPSGRNLHYFEPELSGDSNIKYWGRNPYAGGKWDRISGYGGKFAENITQALSRDLMADAMLRLEDAGFRLLLTVHDEIVSEVTGLLSTFKDVMLSTPSWAAGLPVDAEVFQCARYRK